MINTQTVICNYRTLKNTIFSSLFILLFYCSGQAQSDTLQTTSEKLIGHLTRLVKNNYVYPEIGNEIAENLKTKMDEGYFDQFTNKKEFAEALTVELRSINGDLHLRVKALSPSNTDDGMFSYSNELLENYSKSRQEFAGFNEVRNLGDGVGYLRLSLFRNHGMSIADSYMDLLKTSDAIIIDLRENRGGTVEMVQYLLSYFFDQQTQISTIVGRNGEGVKHFTLDKVNGKKLPDVPLFVLVSNNTASGAEGFTYMIKNQKRGKIIGETTKGAAHSGGTWYINGFSIFIPNERNISPITGTDWEKTGVIPDVQTTEDEAFDVSFNLAKAAANDYRNHNNLMVSRKFSSLWQLLGKSENIILTDAQIEKVHQNIVELVDMDILNEGKINDIGYRYIESEKYKSAELVLKSNTLIYPNSANAYDSYAESLALNEKLNESVANYEMAIKLATEQNAGNTHIYKANLDSVLKQLKSKQ